MVPCPSKPHALILFSPEPLCFSALTLRKQLLEAAKDGRANDMLELLDEGADIKVKDEVRVA